MAPEKWESIIGNIKDKFSVLDEGKEHIDDEGGVDIHYIEFEGPLGRIRLEFVQKPVILDKKTIYSKRIGSETKVDYIYSETEKSAKMTAYKWGEDNDEWQEINQDIFS